MADNVVLAHKTNGEIIYDGEGKENVLKIYEKNLFSNTSAIVVKDLHYKDISLKSASMILSVNETKNNYNGNEGESRWNFLDKSRFTFIREPDDSLKIVKIITKVTATQISNSENLYDTVALF